MPYKCRICGNETDNKPYVGREMKIGLREEFVYIQCANCGCLQIEQYPGNIAKYYEGYASLRNLELKENFLTVYARKQLFDYRMTGKNAAGKWLAKTLPNSFVWIKPSMFDFNSSIIDIGCGTGRLVLKMANTGFSNICGIDPFISEDISYKVKDKTVAIKKQNIYELSGTYDFIMMHHVLEHLPEQHRVFEKLASLMHKNSKLLINIPVIDSYTWDTYGMNAFQLGDVPRHYYLHSVKSFTSLAKQHHLQIEDSLYYGGKIIFADSEKLKRNIVLRDKFKFSKQEKIFFREETKRLIAAKQTGLCCFYLSLK